VTTAPDNHDHDHNPFDAQARQLHAAAVAHVSRPALARLRDARRGASVRRRSMLAPWLAGGAVAATLALAVVLQPGHSPLPATGTPDAPVVAATTPVHASATAADPAEPLQEDPGFYVWLDSIDATALAME